MKFYKHLYVGEGIKSPEKVKWKLRTGAGQMVYILSLSMGNDQLEIMHSRYLKQKYYRKHPPIVVGIAKDYEEAVRLVVQITEESLLRTGACDLKAYLKGRVQKSDQ